MITASNIALSYGKRIIFQDVNIKFTPGNCYGLIGANGAGKSTFLKILAGKLDADRGEIFKGPGQRIAMLSQDQFAFDEHTVFNTVIMGHKKLYKIMAAREALYAKPDFTEEDGILSGELEVKFGEMNGYEAEAEASVLLKGLGIPEEMRQKKMKELDGSDKVRVLLAQALFGNPDILLLDEPTNQLDLKTINWLEEFLSRFNNTVIIVSHDRHFLNQVCTHMADIDFGKIEIYVGNYDFWYEASQLHFRQKETESKKVKAKAEELKEFIRRFSSNASKAKQATSRKKLLEKLTIDNMPNSSRKYPYIVFKPERPCGDIILEIKGLSKEIEGVSMFKDFNLTVNNGDKIAFFTFKCCSVPSVESPVTASISAGILTVSSRYSIKKTTPIANIPPTTMANKVFVITRGLIGVSGSRAYSSIIRLLKPFTSTKRISSRSYCS